MSFRGEKFLWSNEALNRVNTDQLDSRIGNMSEADLKGLFHDIMQDGVHGFCFSLYEDGQSPGDIISREQVERRMKILAPHTRWVRSFSCKWVLKHWSGPG